MKNLREKPLVLQIVSNCEVGGIQRVAVTLATGLPSFGWRSALLTVLPPVSGRQQVASDCTTYSIGSRWGLVVTTLHLARLWRKIAFDVLHVHHFYALCIALFVKWLVGCKVVFTVHSCPPLSFAKRILFRAFLRRANAVTAVSNYSLSYVTSIMDGASWCGATLIGNCVGYSLVPATRQGDELRLKLEFGLESDVRVALSASRLVAGKRVSEIIKVVKLINRMGLKMHLIVAGDGEEYGKLQALSEKLEVASRVSFVGARADLSNLLLGCDLYCSASKCETFGISIAEAMAAGKPAFVDPGGAVREVVTDGLDGFYTSFENTQVAAESIIRALADSESLDRVRAAARATASERFSKNAVLRQYITVYSQLMPDSSAGRIN